jgi:hypothetical protein
MIQLEKIFFHSTPGTEQRILEVKLMKKSPFEAIQLKINE